jgi:hypothetical protein
MSKLRQSAKGQSCAFRIPGVCNGNPETVVLCHAPHPDKGMGIKGPDWWAAYGCSSCHDYMDARSGAWIQYEPREHYWLPAIRETQTRMVKAGLIKV